MSKKKCRECKYFEVDTVSAVCEKKRWICDDDAPACNRFEQQPTVFEQITQSPETLAEKLVRLTCFHHPDGSADLLFASSIVDGRWEDRAKAIAATVAKLKEVAK